MKLAERTREDEGEVEELPQPEPAPSPPVPAGPDPTPSEPVPSEPEEQENQQEEARPLEDVAKEVIAGHWGRGLVRKHRLQAAGYDVQEVNTEVAKIFNK